MTAARRPALAIVMLVIAAAVVAAAIAARNRASDRIELSGTVELEAVELSFRLPGRLKERLVSEGERVAAGQVVARLDDVEFRQELTLRDAQLEAARAVLAEIEAGTRPESIAAAEAAHRGATAAVSALEGGARAQEVRSAEAVLAAMRAELRRAEAHHARMQSLTTLEATSRSDFDAALAARDAASSRVAQASEQLSLVKAGPRDEDIDRARAAADGAKAALDLARAGAREETRRGARAAVDAASAAAHLARTRLDEATLRAPAAGTVLSEGAAAGEYVAPGTPVVTVGDLAKVWVRAYVNEPDLGRVAVGSRVGVVTDSFPDRLLAGRISFVADRAEFTPMSVLTQKVRVGLVFRVKIDVENPEGRLKPGMPVVATLVDEGESR
jgi:HlyD family secretion protein